MALLCASLAWQATHNKMLADQYKILENRFLNEFPAAASVTYEKKNTIPQALHRSLVVLFHSSLSPLLLVLHPC